MLLALADHRPADLTRVHQALTALGEDDQRRLGVITDWKNGPHQLTYRQAEYTFGLVADALAKDEPDGLPSPVLQAICDDLLEASIPDQLKDASTSLAVDWDRPGDLLPAPAGERPLRRPRGLLGPPQEQPAAQPRRAVLRLLPVRRDHGARGERARSSSPSSPAAPRSRRRRDHPVRAFAPVLTALPGQGIPLGDILDDSGYYHRDADAWALPLRGAGAQLVQDLHPHDRGPKGTHHGAIIANGSLYCPCTPRPLTELGPLARTATKEQAADHDRQTTELARYKLGRLTADDADGYHRVQCPAATGKIRCPLRPASMTLDRAAEILRAPEHPQACCAQQTITVPPDVNAKTRVAVGTALAGGPPRRSQRAGLPHWAPTSGAWRRSVPRGRDARCGSAVATGSRIRFIRGPGRRWRLAAAPQRLAPVPGHLVAEGLDRLAVAGHRVVGHVPAHHAGQPSALLRDGLVQAPPELVFNLLQLRPHPSSSR